MKKYSSNEIRNMWLNFFESKKHEIIESKSLIPVNDPSILWINSGVATLKDYFTGKKMPRNPRIANSQKCIRTNDIENVGLTSRHHTFFEMLGNFSMGDYFKDGAIEFAYEVIFNLYKFEKRKIYITYFKKDKDTYKKWISLGVDKSHMIEGDKDTNFWDIGQGPCGPCTEIFYDRGEKYDPNNVGLKLLKEDLENDRYIEIWNIVFSEFNNDGEKNYEELKQKNIDTGAGLERIACISQNVPTNFDTDLFMLTINKIEEMTNQKYNANDYFNPVEFQTAINKKMKVIVDHMRAVVISVQDGAKPSNTQRGYIIRRLIRRAYRSGIQLGLKKQTFLSELIPAIKKTIPWYEINQSKVKKIIEKEEIIFSKTINQGEKILINELKNTTKEFDPIVAFKLFETFGFPIELTQEIIGEKGIKLDLNKIKELMRKHAKKSKGKATVGMDKQIQVIQKITSKVSSFTGYEETKRKAKVICQEREGNKYYVLLDKTPFYATKGGQLHDWGTIDGEEVLNVFRDKFENHWHILKEKTSNKHVIAQVNEDLRVKKTRNHTSTHLLGLALTKVFGINTIQLGSDNNENRLRLDFNLDNKPTKKQLQEVEDIVNDLIKQTINREYKLMEYQDAIDNGVLALEGGDYGEGLLRVVEFNESKEFCGGTHIENTSLIEKFKILKIDSKGLDTFRLEAITSNYEILKYEKTKKEQLIKEINLKVEKNKKLDENYDVKIKGSINELNELLNKIIWDNKMLIKKQKNNVKINFEFIDFVQYNGMKTHINLNFNNPNQLKTVAINLREKFNDSLIIIGSPSNEKITLAIASNEFNSKVIFDELANKHNGKGGGNQKIAMGSMKKFKI